MGEILLRQESAPFSLALLQRSEGSQAVLSPLLQLRAIEVGYPGSGLPWRSTRGLEPEPLPWAMGTLLSPAAFAAGLALSLASGLVTSKQDALQVFEHD